MGIPDALEKVTSCDFFGLGGEIPKLICDFLINHKNKKEANICTLMFIAVKAVLELNYHSFKINKPDEDDELLNKIKNIIGELRIDDITLIANGEKLNDFVNKFKESNVIDIKTVNGDGCKADINQFYYTFKKHLKSFLNQRVYNNKFLYETLDMELQQVTYNNSEEIKVGLEDIKKILLNIQLKLDEAIRKEEEKNNNILISSMGEYNEDDYSDVVDLRENFEFKKIKDTSSWDKVTSEARNSYRNIKKKLNKDGTNYMYLSLHLSLAFHAGACFNGKGMHNLSLKQKTPRGIVDWSINTSLPLEDYNDIKFNFTNNFIDENSKDIVISISTGAKRLYDPDGDEDSNDLNYYIHESDMKVRRILDFNMGDAGGNSSVKSGVHARFLAEQVRKEIDRLSRKDKEGKMHIFLATPVSFAFFLGQISFEWTNVQLYEFINDTKTYLPSIFIRNIDELGR